MVSGIDRDSIVEQMTLGTRTKIANQQKQYTKLQWKQEAYRSLSDKIIDWQDKYASYSSSSSLKDSYTFAKNVITLHGKEDSTQFVKATGTSQFVDNVAIAGVKQLATSSVQQSGKHVSANGLQTGLKSLDQKFFSSNLEGSRLTFGVETTDENGNVSYVNSVTFTFSGSYTVEDGGKTTTKTLDYNFKNADGSVNETKLNALITGLNEALKSAKLQTGPGKDIDISDRVTFINDGGKIKLEGKDGSSEFGENIKIDHLSSALKALGFDDAQLTDDEKKKGIDISTFNDHRSASTFGDTAISEGKALDALTGQKLTFKYDGSQKDITMITEAEKAIMEDPAKLKEALKEQIGQAKLDELVASGSDLQMEYLKNNLQKRLDQAFGKDAVTARIGQDGLTFTTKDDSTVSVTSDDNDMLRNLGIQNGASTKVNLNGTLNQASIRGNYGADDPLELEINGVKIEGLTGKSTISDILSKINDNKEVGVKATYVESTGCFMLVSSETGAGRQITLDSALARDLFGEKDAAGNYIEKGGFTEGQNAIIDVNYGNGTTVTLNRASNTFDLEGLSVTVSGVFGGEWDENLALKKPFASEPAEPTDKTDSAAIEKYEKDKIAWDDFNAAVADLQKKYGEKNVIFDEDGNVTNVWKGNASGAVTFSAKADVDGVTEKVKSFIEDFNALVTEINKQVTTRPDSDYEPLTDEQRDEMDETSIENWEKKAKEGLLYGDSAIRDLSTDVQSIFVKMMNNGASYEDLKKIGITYSEDYTDGGTLVFDEATFRSAMESDPDLVSNIFTGGGNVSKGMIDTIYGTLSPYATRYASDNNGKSYGSLIDIAGSEKKPTTLIKNQIYEQLKQMQETIDSLKDRLSTEEQRYINQFTTMESLINKFNTQSSYLSQITG